MTNNEAYAAYTEARYLAAVQYETDAKIDRKSAQIKYDETIDKAVLIRDNLLNH